MTTKKESICELQNVASSRVIGRNTFEVVYHNGDRAIRLHKTDVITFKVYGDVTLDSGGWKTATTKARINEHLNFRQSGYKWLVYQNNRVWYIDTPKEKDVVFFDGITFDIHGRLLSKPLKDESQKIKDTKKAIKNYLSLIDKLETLPKPSIEDCWLCLRRAKDGQSLGGFTEEDHIADHIKEMYLHGSIICNALLSAGYQEQQLPYLYALNCKDTAKRALRRYLGKHLLPSLAY